MTELPPIIGVSEIGALYGKNPQAANKWAESERFPKHVYRLRAGRFWLLSEVEAWGEKYRPNQPDSGIVPPSE